MLDELLEQLGDDSSSFESVFSQYSDDRCVNCEHICRLAMENYIEMRDHVTSTSFLIRKKFDLWLNRWLGDTWMPLYSMVQRNVANS